MKSLIKLGLTILVIVLCCKFCSGCGEGVKAAGIETGKAIVEVVNTNLDKEIEVTEPSEDPYDKLYAIEDENSVQGKTLREIGAESWKEVKESMEVK